MKGIASAVVLTAGLAAGQANADNTLTGSDGILQDTEVTADYKDADITVSGVKNDELQEGPYASVMQFSGDVTDFTGSVTITGDLSTSSYPNYVSGAAFTGTGSLTLDAAEGKTATLTVNDTTSKSGSDSLGNVAVTDGT